MKRWQRDDRTCVHFRDINVDGSSVTMNIHFTVHADCRLQDYQIYTEHLD